MTKIIEQNGIRYEVLRQVTKLSEIVRELEDGMLVAVDSYIDGLLNQCVVMMNNLGLPVLENDPLSEYNINNMVTYLIDSHIYRILVVKKYTARYEYVANVELKRSVDPKACRTCTHSRIATNANVKNIVLRCVLTGETVVCRYESTTGNEAIDYIKKYKFDTCPFKPVLVEE